MDPKNAKKEREKKLKGQEKEVDTSSHENFDEASYYEDGKFELGGVEYDPETDQEDEDDLDSDYRPTSQCSTDYDRNREHK